MYEGNNKAAIQSQNSIAQALFSLLRERPFGEISVSQVCQLAGVSRQTFYSRFQSREDVIVYGLRHSCCYTPDETAGEEPLRALCRSFARFLTGRGGMIRLLAEQNLTGCLYQSLRESFVRCGCRFGSLPEAYRPYTADFLASGFTSVARTWAEEGGQLDAGAVEELALALFRGGLWEREKSVDGDSPLCYNTEKT